MGQKSRPPIKVAPGELELLEILWKDVPLTLADVHALMPRSVAYTTVQTRLNRLAEKGLIDRDAERPAKYAAIVGRDAVRAGMIEVIVDRVSEGQVVPLVAQLVADRKLSAREIAEIKLLIEQAEKSLSEGKSNKERK